MGSHLIIAVNKNLPLIGITQHCCHGILLENERKNVSILILIYLTDINLSCHFLKE
jgi:hypothetical protein